MKLHENKILFRQAIQSAADQLKLPIIYVEKDYWVTLALFKIFKNDIGKEIVFKGGTSLSKCYHLIDRFSEDIDLLVIRKEGESNNKLKSKLKVISTMIMEELPEIEIDGITQKKGMNRKTAHHYNKEFKGDFGMVRDVIILESTWLSFFEPFTTQRITSLVGQMMLDNNLTSIVEENGLNYFDLNALHPTRTICEKIMSLVRFSYGENPKESLKNKIRHIYDLHKLLLFEDFLEFFHSSNFDEMLLNVAMDDLFIFKNNNKWLLFHPKEALIFRDAEVVWSDLKSSYNFDFKNLVYGELPSHESVLKTLITIQKRLNKISWTLTIDNKL
jgi:hypothetical protein